MKIYDWNTEYKQVCELIRSTRAVFKIVLKSKNETYFLERWIQYHKNILRKTKLIIFDNLSDEKETLDLYEKYADDLILVSFSSHVDSIHMRNPEYNFKPLYQALMDSSKFYQFLDTDEFLGYFDGEKLIKDSSMVSFMGKNTGVNFFATCWLHNKPYCDDIFYFNPDRIRDYVYGGKPIINSLRFRHYFDYPTNHTFWLSVSFSYKAPLGFVVLHINTYLREQRIRTNMNKLASIGLIKHPKDYYSVMTLAERDWGPPNFRSYIPEIRRLLANPDEHLTANHDIEENTFQVLPDGRMQFYSPEQ